VDELGLDVPFELFWVGSETEWVKAKVACLVVEEDGGGVIWWEIKRGDGWGGGRVCVF